MSWVAKLYVFGMHLWVESKSQTDTEQRLDRCWFGKVDKILELNFRLGKKATVQSRKSDIDAIESGYFQDWHGDCRTVAK